jgi:chemotaxis protein CheZ
MPLAAARRLGAELRGRRKEQTVAQQPNDPRAFVRELAEVAEYIQHLRREINALRANEIWRDRLPEAGRELGGVVKTTASATHRIMGAAEDILAIRNVPVEQYRSFSSFSRPAPSRTSRVSASTGSQRLCRSWRDASTASPMP